jgi:hypothetical protein
MSRIVTYGFPCIYLFLTHSITGYVFQNLKNYRPSDISLYQKKNRQGDLLKKLEIAKEQARQRLLLGDENRQGATKYQLTDEEIKIQNDRKRFEELLNSESFLKKNTLDYKTLEQEEEEMNAGCKLSGSMAYCCLFQSCNS